MPRFQLLTRSSAFVFASALAIGLAFPLTLFNSDSANAAGITTLTVTSTGPLTAGQVNSAPIVVTFTSPTELTAHDANSAYLSLVGAVAVTQPSGSDCTGVVTIQNNHGFSTGCALFASRNVNTQAMGFASNGNWPAGTIWTFTYDANTLTLPNAATMIVRVSTFLALSARTDFDAGELAVPLVGYVAPTKTVTFDANGGDGTMANQVASAATNLTASSFTRSGYSFTGWNTLANGAGTAFTDAASFPFAGDQTLYAQWAAIPVAQPATLDAVTSDPKLAVTGTSSDSANLWTNSALMITTGLGLLLVVQLRTRSQSYIYSINQLSKSAWKNYLSSSGHN
jgi:uncharacterized repeat protein (TIGR02543 family)